jgi:hypothetical protein
VVRSAVDTSYRNRRVSFKSDVQESLQLLDTMPSIVWKDSHHKYKSRKSNNDVSNRTRSKAVTQTSILAVELGLSCTT